MEERGSEKLLRQMFGAEGPVTHESLAESVKAAQAEYKIKSWWIRGQPIPDHLMAIFDVEPAQLGTTVQKIAGMHGQQTAIGCEVFPLGIPRPDVMQLRVDARFNIKR